jgi:hypothetical protein
LFFADFKQDSPGFLGILMAVPDSGCSEKGRAAVGGSGSVVVVGPVEDHGALSIPPDLEDSGVDAIFSGRFPSPATTHVPAKVYDIRMAGVYRTPVWVVSTSSGTSK